MKTLRERGIIKEGRTGGHLVVSFDNCGGQNKNNTMIMILMYLYEMRYFKKLTFLFLIAGHTKNACDRLFNSLKADYRTQNLFTVEDLERALAKSDYVTVKPATVEDFFDYDTFLRMFYRKLPKQINQNHVFSCGSMEDAQGCELGSDFKISLLRSFREADKAAAVIPQKCRKRNWWTALPERNHANEAEASLKRVDDLKEMCGDPDKLTVVKPPGLNPYKVVEMWSNFRPLVPLDKKDDVLYREPTVEEWAVVKKEKRMNKEKKVEVKKMKRETMETEDEVVGDDSRKAKKPRTTDSSVPSAV